MRAYDFSRGLTTALFAGVAGGLVWVAGAYFGTGTVNDFWISMGIIAGAGLVMALSQLIGGWTKHGAPRFSAGVFVFGFLPVLVCVGWVLLGTQPNGGWQHHHITSWSSSVGIGHIVSDLATFNAVLAFGFGLVLGYCFDTMPVARGVDDDVVVDRRRRGFGRRRPAMERTAADEPLTAERTTVLQRDGVREREPVGARPARGTAVERDAETGEPVSVDEDRPPRTMD
ncbi:MAG TPA: hypothetical protein VGF23_14525 [Gaiellaceae bacterium]